MDVKFGKIAFNPKVVQILPPPPPQERITDGGDLRVTDDGQVRITD